MQLQGQDRAGNINEFEAQPELIPPTAVDSKKPENDITAFSNVRGVIKGGKLIYAAQSCCRPSLAYI